MGNDGLRLRVAGLLARSRDPGKVKVTHELIIARNSKFRSLIGNICYERQEQSSIPWMGEDGPLLRVNAILPRSRESRVCSIAHG